MVWTQATPSSKPFTDGTLLQSHVFFKASFFQVDLLRHKLPAEGLHMHGVSQKLVSDPNPSVTTALLSPSHKATHVWPSTHICPPGLVTHVRPNVACTQAGLALSPSVTFPRSVCVCVCMWRGCNSALFYFIAKLYSSAWMRHILVILNLLHSSWVSATPDCCCCELMSVLWCGCV